MATGMLETVLLSRSGLLMSIGAGFEPKVQNERKIFQNYVKRQNTGFTLDLH